MAVHDYDSLVPILYKSRSSLTINETVKDILLQYRKNNTMKVLFLFLCFEAFLIIASKPLTGTDESKENDILQEILKEMIDQWKKGQYIFKNYNLFPVLTVVHG